MKAYLYEGLRCGDCHGRLCVHTQFREPMLVTLSCHNPQCAEFQVHYEPPQVELSRAQAIPHGVPFRVPELPVAESNIRTVLGM